MITVFIAFCIPVLIGLWVNGWTIPSPPLRAEDRGIYVIGIVIFMLATTVITVGGAGVASWLGDVTAEPGRMDATPSHVAAMVNMRSVDSVAGAVASSLFLVRGFIGPTEIYRWYEKSWQGSLEPGQTDVGPGDYIFEEDRTDGLIRIYDWHRTHPRWARWIALFDDSEKTGQTYEFYIPKGSTQRDFKLQ